MHPGRQLQRFQLEGEVTEVARLLLGAVIETDSAAGRVAVRLTEVEAYAGLDDPASRAYRGRTPRTAVMFGPAGHLYTYFVYGMHWCANIVTGPDGLASAVLLRAAEVVDGIQIARTRRRPGGDRPAPEDRHLARGPAGLATVLGLNAASNGADLLRSDGSVRLLGGAPQPASRVGVGPRVGVAAAADEPRRFWLLGDPTVSAFRAWVPRRRSVPDSRRGRGGTDDAAGSAPTSGMDGAERR